MDIDNIIVTLGIDKINLDLGIPKRTLENWLYHMSTPPAYVVTLIAYYYGLDAGRYVV